jgi:hypothetical protein
MPEILILLIMGLVAGVLSGMFGIGGGAIIVPSLMLFMGYSQTNANGTSLAALLLPVGIFACIEYYRAGKLKLSISTLVALGLLGGSWFGANIALGLPPFLLKSSYGIFLLYAAWRYIAPLTWYREAKGLVQAKSEESTPVDLNNRRIQVISFAVGLLAGLASGMFGIGGGLVIVPALMAFLHFDQKLATGTSLGALLLPVALPAVLRYYETGNVNLGAAAPLAILLMIFAVVGARITLGLPAKTIRRMYGFFLLFISLRFVIEGISAFFQM